MISGGYHFTFFHSFVAKSYDLITLAGQPAQIEYAGMERLTTLPAATTQCFPKVTPGSMTEFAPTHTSSSIVTGCVLTPCSVSYTHLRAHET